MTPDPLYYTLAPVYEHPTGGMRAVGYTVCDVCGATLGDGHGRVLCPVCVRLVLGGGPLRELLREESRRARREESA